MYESIQMRWTGHCPLLLHNGDLANPRNQFTKAIKSISGKRKKTDTDFDLMSAMEWAGSLYAKDPISFKVGDDNSVTFQSGGKIYIPAEVIEATLVESAKKQRLGRDFTAGVLVESDPILEFPDSGWGIQELWDSERYLDIRKVRVQKNSVMRTRPRFDSWAIQFKVNYFSDVIPNVDTLVDVAVTAGNIIGLCDYRPRFGRFSVEVVG